MGPLVSSFQYSARAAFAAGSSVFLAEWIGLPFPIYAMISAVIVTDLDPEKTRKLGVPRVFGTVVGAGYGAALVGVLPHGIPSIAFGIFVAMFTCHLSGWKDAAKLAGYLCALVLLGYSQSPWTYAFYRLVETLLGVGVALALSFVPKLLRSPPSP